MERKGRVVIVDDDDNVVEVRDNGVIVVEKSLPVVEKIGKRPDVTILKILRQLLKEDGKNICYSEWCSGIIKGLEKFCKGTNVNRCLDCSVRYRKKSDTINIPAFRRIKFKLKLGKKCEICECDDIEMLDFDHIDQETKNFNLATKKSVANIIEESKKTRILCVWCHRLHSKKQTDENIIMKKEDYDYTQEENDEIIDSDNSKSCNGIFCNGRLRDIKYFYIIKNILKSLCIKCSGYNGLVKRLENREYVINIKLKIGSCQKCDKKVTKDTVCCFDFDHIDRKTKLFNISRLVQRGNNVKEKIDDEIKKCQLLCCYCHRKKSNEESGYEKLDLEKLYKLDNISRKVINLVCACGKPKSRQAEKCVQCASLSTRKVSNRPEYNVLLKEIDELGYCGAGRKYGVTNNAIKKWMVTYEKNMVKDENNNI